MRACIESAILPSLPLELQKSIIDTNVESSHGSEDTGNFVSTDKLYLLSAKEVCGQVAGGVIINYDSSETQTRQLDYYNSIANLGKQCSGAGKKNGIIWWLRTAASNQQNGYYGLAESNYVGRVTHESYGVSPAFRLG